MVYERIIYCLRAPA